MVIKDYFKYLNNIFHEVIENESDNIEKAAKLVVESMANGGKFYVFGTGHSHLVAEELFQRAGGLSNIEAILPPELMLHEYPGKSTMIERLEGYGRGLFNLYDIKEKDCFLIISNSGRNAAPIEMAMSAKEKGCAVIVMTSLAHSQSVASRHHSGKHLFDFGDVVLDTHAPIGDAGFELQGLDTKVGPVSDFIGIGMAQALTVAIADIMLKQGLTPPILRSANLDGSEEHNKKVKVQKL